MSGATACPDCSGVQKGRALAHDETCLLARALDRVTEEDRDWFQAHPEATVRDRRLTAAEKVEQRLGGNHDADRMTRVQVIQIAPGLRARHPYRPGARASLSPLSSAEVAALRARFKGVGV